MTVEVTPPNPTLNTTFYDQPEAQFLAPPIKKWKYKPTEVKFDEKKHLDMSNPAWKKGMRDFGYDSNNGISDFAAAAPFRMFTDEAVRLMRNDILSGPVQENHAVSSPRSPYMLRGYGHRRSPFIYSALTNPNVLRKISDVVGIDLVPAHDFEVGHVNIQLGFKGKEGIRDLSDIPTLPVPQGDVEASDYDNRPVDDWHFDQVPFVAVLMLSDTTGMQGGETAVMTKDGTVDVVPGPKLGSIAILQGSKIRHAALRVSNCSERIAMVLSLRPRNVFVEDMTCLTNSRGHDDIQNLGISWLDYRLKVMEDRCKITRQRLLETDKFDKKDVVEFCKSQMKHFDITARELFPEI